MGVSERRCLQTRDRWFFGLRPWHFIGPLQLWRRQEVRLVLWCHYVHVRRIFQDVPRPRANFWFRVIFGIQELLPSNRWLEEKRRPWRWRKRCRQLLLSPCCQCVDRLVRSNLRFRGWIWRWVDLQCLSKRRRPNYGRFHCLRLLKQLWLLPICPLAFRWPSLIGRWLWFGLLINWRLISNHRWLCSSRLLRWS